VKIVFDTNVLYAALTARAGLCARLFELCLARHSIGPSQHIFGELRRHLAGKGKLSDEQLNTILHAVSDAAEMVVPSPVDATACRDADDLPVLGTALAAGAELIVSGDRDLLDVVLFERVSIVSPRTLYDRPTAAAP
jgi:putative PIN family toxin of toxin-antitoxin system